MRTKIVEFTNGLLWGRFLLGRYSDEEWQRPALAAKGASPLPLLMHTGADARALWVLDLVTREGACFRPGGSVKADLEKHAVRVCPMFPVFLGWLYERPEFWREPLSFLELPDLIEVPRDYGLEPAPPPLAHYPFADEPGR